MKKKIIINLTIAITLLMLGIILNYFQIGINNTSMGSSGNWLIYISLIMLIITVFRSFKKERKIDERQELLGWKTARITFIAYLILTFLIMIVDVIKPINSPIYIVFSYQICFLTLFQAITYKILEKKN